MAERKNHEATSSYWYDDDADDVTRAILVLQALRRFKAADSAMRHRTQAEMDMNETDLLALRHLIAAEARGHEVGPKELSEVLRITTAATAKLLARLVHSGHIRREVHPTDRRAQRLYATRNAHQEVRKTLGDMHERMIAVAQDFSAEQQRAIIDFLDAMSTSMHTPAEESKAARHSLATRHPAAH
ncbi:MarR family winged helix-turn-helix transcriptional regulator [Glaciibacter psychrotolerans]|uniref:DNA-binding MarR family transcriptional regulator n=1 Tax=Glaciibacter psychrotolerans TaxID=670054 RepID=A0A7Z0J6Z4_9MICO|nr:MarR family transcriptional regulator [Leifsonia psychrotolerans]NYJ20721.1 DNA-binding MarR family transcriptional regulator [Leifsonia psychrotolerans]